MAEGPETTLTRRGRRGAESRARLLADVVMAESTEEQGAIADERTGDFEAPAVVVAYSPAAVLRSLSLSSKDAADVAQAAR